MSLASSAQGVMRLKVRNMLDISVLHGDRSTTPAKKGGGNIGYSGHKHFKGEKVIGLTIAGSNMSLDSAYDSRENRKFIFNSGMTPNIPENNAIVKKPCAVRSDFRSQPF